MAKRVAEPSYSRDHIEGIFQPLMPYHHIFYKILIYWACLITSYPTTIDKFKSSIFNHLLDSTLSGLVLHVPPPLKIPYLSMCEPDIWILPHIGCDIRKYPLDTSILSCSIRVVPSIEVFYGSPEPACILMRVRYHMECFSFITWGLLPLLLSLIKFWCFFKKTSAC